MTEEFPIGGDLHSNYGNMQVLETMKAVNSLRVKLNSLAEAYQSRRQLRSFFNMDSLVSSLKINEKQSLD